MSKGNLFLGYARGRVGDVVFSRQGGEQVARARNRAPKNPQTAQQLLQRVVMKTVSTAYSHLQEICNHSFQGLQEGTPNQSRFAALNVARLRARLQEYIQSGDPIDILTCDETNFSVKSSSLAEFNDYIISEGSLSPLQCAFAAGAFRLLMSSPSSSYTTANLTYQNVVDGLNAQRGDQLTFVFVSVDDREVVEADGGKINGFRFARIILEPNDGDMTSLFFNSGAINKPNGRNQGDIAIRFADGSSAFEPSAPSMTTQSGGMYEVAGFAAILSRMVGSTWARSPQSLLLRPSLTSVEGHLAFDHGVDTLQAAIASYMTMQDSTLYLNQAENF